MCDAEFVKISSNYPLSWGDSKNKWFGTHEFVHTRVLDGKFNNSKFVNGRYIHVVEYVVESGSEHLVNCGKNEYMLNVRKAPLVKIKLTGKINP